MAGLVNNECGTLGVLLGNLLGFDGSGELGGEGQMLNSSRDVSSGPVTGSVGMGLRAYRQGDIIKSNIEARGTPGQVLPNQTGDVLTLGDQLAGVELSDNALQDLVDNGGQHTLVKVLAKGTVNLWQSIDAGPGQDTAGDVDHLQILGTSQGGNVARLRADIVNNRGFDPGNPEVSS